MNTDIPSSSSTYLLSAILFVVGLKRLQSPATARAGNALAAVAMLLAIVATVVDTEILSWTGILIGVAIGAVIGGVAARTVQMTAMPQMVGIFNGFGGGASALVAVAEFLAQPRQSAPGTGGLTILLGTLIGGVTFSGSFIAFAKLQELMTGNPITFPGQNALQRRALPRRAGARCDDAAGVGRARPARHRVLRLLRPLPRSSAS